MLPTPIFARPQRNMVNSNLDFTPLPRCLPDLLPPTAPTLQLLANILHTAPPRSLPLLKQTTRRLPRAPHRHRSQVPASSSAVVMRRSGWTRRTRSWRVGWRRTCRDSLNGREWHRPLMARMLRSKSLHSSMLPILLLSSVEDHRRVLRSRVMMGMDHQGSNDMADFISQQWEAQERVHHLAENGIGYP